MIEDIILIEVAVDLECSLLSKKENSFIRSVFSYLVLFFLRYKHRSSRNMYKLRHNGTQLEYVIELSLKSRIHCTFIQIKIHTHTYVYNI